MQDLNVKLASQTTATSVCLACDEFSRSRPGYCENFLFQAAEMELVAKYRRLLKEAS